MRSGLFTPLEPGSACCAFFGHPSAQYDEQIGEPFAGFLRNALNASQPALIVHKQSWLIFLAFLCCHEIAFLRAVKVRG